MQCSHYLYDILLKEKKVIYFCKFTFNPKIIFLFRLPIPWTLSSRMSANHYRSAGAACAGNQNWSTRSRASQRWDPWGWGCSGAAGPQTGCKLDGSSAADKGSQAWEGEQKRSLQQSGKRCSPGCSPVCCEGLRCQREVFCRAAREEDARSVTPLLLLSHADGWHPPWQRQPRAWCCAALDNLSAVW